MAKHKPKKAAPTPPVADIIVELDFGSRMDQFVAQAIADYNEPHGWPDPDKRQRAIALGVTRRAHGWCVDFTGPRDALVRVGVALADWFESDRLCKEVKIGRRSFEIYRDSIVGNVEVSARYTDAEIAQLFA